MQNTILQKTMVVSIQGWELEVLEGPRTVQVDLVGEMLEFRGVWLTEPERGLVTVLCFPDKIFYVEITESEIPAQRPGRRNKVTPLRRINNTTPEPPEDNE